MSDKKLEILKSEVESELVNNILPFWSEKMVDNEYGGFYGRIDGYGQTDQLSDKGCVLNARILWTFSAAYRVLKNPEYLKISEKSKDPSRITFTQLNKTFELYLPDAKVFLDAVRPLEITTEQSHQPFFLEVTKVADLKQDHYGLTFMSADKKEIIATAEFQYKGDSVAYDEKNKDFLESFQSVRRSQRGTVLPIDSGLGGAMGSVANHSAQVYIAPWIYARYSEVSWIIGYGNEDEIPNQWKSVIDKSPVVDLFLFNHGGADIQGLRNSDQLGWKRHQIRLLYTEGCESASSDYFETFLSKYNAAVGIGHRETSASPFFSFSLIRFWTYGSSALSATKAAWDIGAFLARTVDYISFKTLSSGLWNSQDAMIRESAMGLEWTAEMPPEKLYIDQSTVINRASPQDQIRYLSFIDNFGKDIQASPLQMDFLSVGLP